MAVTESRDPEDYDYVDKALDWFDMSNVKLVSTSLKLSTCQLNITHAKFV